MVFLVILAGGVVRMTQSGMELPGLAKMFWQMDTAYTGKPATCKL